MPRWRRERKCQKSDRLNRQNNITLLLYVFCRSFSTTTWKCLILYFKEDVTKRWRNFLFLNLDMVVMNSTPKNSLALFCKRVGIISIEIERKSAPFLNDVFGTLNSTWATSLFFKFAKIETKESFVTRTNALLAGTLIYNRWRQREDRYCIKKGADLEVLIITVCILDRRCSRRWVSIERNQTNEHVSRIQTGMLPQQGLLGIRRFVRH